MRPLTIVALALALSGCASDTWSRSDTLWQSAATATLLIDGYQTSRIRHTQYEEVGSVRGICGPLPSTQCTATYFGSVALSHWLIARSLPPTWRRYWQGGMVLTEVRVIERNDAKGIR